MNPEFQKLIMKKKAEGTDMSPAHQSAKSSVLDDLMEHLGSMGMDKVNGLKKVSVASNSKEGLKHGLDKAKDLLDHSNKGEDEHDPEMSDHGPNPDTTDSDEEQESESPEAEESSEHEDKDAEIARLKAELAKHRKG